MEMDKKILKTTGRSQKKVSKQEDVAVTLRNPHCNGDGMVVFNHHGTEEENKFNESLPGV